MAKFILSTDKAFIIAGQYRQFKAGELETEEPAVIEVLSKSVEQVADKPAPKKK